MVYPHCPINNSCDICAIVSRLPHSDVINLCHIAVGNKELKRTYIKLKRDLSQEIYPAKIMPFLQYVAVKIAV